LGTDSRAKGHVLAQFAPFAGLDRQVQRTIASHVHERTFGPGQAIMAANEPCRAVYLVVWGEVRTCWLSTKGREYVLEDLGAGQLFNLASVLDGGRTLATVTTVTRTMIYAIPCETFRQIVHEHCEVAMAVLAHMAGRIRRLSGTVEDLAFRPVRARLARCLLSHLNGGPRPVGRLTYGELAAHIGSVRDVVGRTLRAFSEEGLIRRERGRLVVMDPSGLRREAMCE
jgi:CRP/FNR family transcriptional regulator